MSAWSSAASAIASSVSVAAPTTSKSEASWALSTAWTPGSSSAIRTRSSEPPSGLDGSCMGANHTGVGGWAETFRYAARSYRPSNQRASRRSDMPRTLPLLVLAATTAAAFPSAAAATPTLHADRSCYTEQQPIVLTGGGYTPSGPIAFLGNFTGNAGNANAVPLGSPIAADAAGALSFRLPAPALSSQRDIQETLTISANDQA